MTRPCIALAAPCSMLVATSASARKRNSDLVIQPFVVHDFRRQRNVSVTQQSSPDYNALGVSVGRMRLNLGVKLGSEATFDTCLSPVDAISLVFLYQQGSARLTSAWSRHALQVSPPTTHRKHLRESARNQHLCSSSASRQLDISHTLRIDRNVGHSRQLENLFSGEFAPTVVALSQGRRDYTMSRGTYTCEQIRMFVMADRAKFRFPPGWIGRHLSIGAGGRYLISRRVSLETRATYSPRLSNFVDEAGIQTSLSYQL